MYIFKEQQAEAAKRDKIKEKYPKGCKIVAIHIEDRWNSICENKVATVTCVDAFGVLHCKTENGVVFQVSPYYNDKIEIVKEV